MHPGRRRLFIYYRLKEHELRAACEAVRQVQQALQHDHRGLSAELLAGAGADGLRTVMETYVVDARINAGGVQEPLQAAIEAALQTAVRPWLQGARHVEVFEDLG